jgi:FKBP-type peptidyl-prolyl cis-trans isomerase
MIRKLLLATAALTVLAGCNQATEQGASSNQAADNAAISTDAKVTTKTGLKYTILKEGAADAPVAKAGDTVSVHYTGYLTNGSKFDSSVDRNQPFEFPLGAGRVIPGWDEGVAGMKVGEKRKLVIAPELGYGSRDMGQIPPNSTLVFEVELLGIKKQ